MGAGGIGPRTLSQAVIRDRFSGQAMARTMTMVQTIFYAGPITAPLVGQGLLELGGSWRWVIGFGTFTAAALLIWSLRLEETLAPENRRRLHPGETLPGFRLVVTNQTTLCYALAITLGFSAFYSFLGGTELGFTDIFGRDELFVPFFSTVSCLFAVAGFTTNRMLRRVPAVRWARGAAFTFTGWSALMFIVSTAWSGTPPFWLWVGVFALTNATFATFFPTANSLALEPMQAVAGTAAATIGASSAIIGAFLSSFVDRAIEGTVTPLGVGYLSFSLLAVASALAASHPRPTGPTRPSGD